MSPLEESGPPGRCSAPGSRRGQRPGPALPAHGLERRGEGKGSWRAGLAGALPWHSSAPGSGAGRARARSCHHYREGSPAGLQPQVTGREALRARRGTGSGGQAGEQGSPGLDSGPAAAWLPKWGARGKARRRRSGAGAPLPACLKLGNFSPSLGGGVPVKKGPRGARQGGAGPRVQT